MANASNRRKKILRALAVLVWLLMLCGISYYLFLPDLDAASQQLKAIREDPNLTPQEKFEKSREIYSKLTPEQGQQVFQSDMKKLHYERNREMQKFLKMSPEEQVAYLKQKAEERKKLGQKDVLQMAKPGTVFKPGDGGAGAGAGPVRVGAGGVAGVPGGGGMVARIGGGPGGGGQVFFGPPGGGGFGNPSQMQKNMLDASSPETRAGQFYQRGLMSK